MLLLELFCIYLKICFKKQKTRWDDMKRDPVIRCFLNFLFPHKYHLKTFQPTNTPPFSRMKQRSQASFAVSEKKKVSKLMDTKLSKKSVSGFGYEGGGRRRVLWLTEKIKSISIRNFKYPFSQFSNSLCT